MSGMNGNAPGRPPVPPDMIQVQGEWVNRAIASARFSAPDSPDQQLSILVCAVAVAGKSLGVDVCDVVNQIEKLYDAPLVLQRSS